MWVTAEDILGDWIGDDLPSASTDAITRWIGKAERLVRREFPTLSKRIEERTDPDLLDTVKDVVSSMVTRVLRNPDGKRSINKGAGPYSESVTFGGDTPGVLFLTPEERDALSPASMSVSRQAFTIGLASRLGMCHALWCDVMFARGSCSCGADIAGRAIYERARA